MTLHPQPSAAKPAQRGRAWDLVVVGSLFLLLSLYFAYAALWSSVQQRGTAGFLTVQAKILASDVRPQASSGNMARRTYHPHVRYSYTVGGVVFENTRIHFLGPTWTGHDDVQALVDRFPVGAEVTAYHDRRDPGISVLDNTPHPPSGPMILLLLTLVAGSLLVVRHGWKRGS